MDNIAPIHSVETSGRNEPSGVSTGFSTGTTRFPSRNESVLRDRQTADIQNEIFGSDFTHRSSGPIHLEPPPVVVRPPKIKSDGFSHAAFSWLSWSNSEQKDISHCVRSTRKSYTSTKTFQLFGVTVTRAITFKTTESGVDAARVNVGLGWHGKETHWVRDHLPKVQEKLQQYARNEPTEATEWTPSQENSTTATDVEQQKLPGGESGRSKGIHRFAHPWLHDYYYVVVGFMSEESIPREKIRRVVEIQGLFQQIRKAQRQLRNPFRRMLSLKEVSGFGIYECDPIKGYHREVELDKETERALAELWRSYNGNNLDYEGRWLMWIHQHFNNGSKNPEMGRLALELKLQWSVFKVVIWGIIPVLLSLAIGFWYMYSDHGDVDDVAVAEAAWVIASYIVTTSALLLALLAVITQLGNI
ncbi:uncharacterized protein PV06_08761 [Exophiala oligosperma]|uniref:Uncharacterized protein n=2 Tax=Chaetothyriales TaxID=34395 RepID=A0A0D2D928_9EURO|nr:uncharacterized protein PV06_08761 [Exophiala oligosperma]KAJ9644949.1 hypothetical protein H2204_001411 [Knufia peltigerae]KIW38940.1 hypothetical protein PV06_08761 [Exophiala oligosperma]